MPEASPFNTDPAAEAAVRAVGIADEHLIARLDESFSRERRDELVRWAWGGGVPAAERESLRKRLEEPAFALDAFESLDRRRAESALAPQTPVEGVA